jgi:hypothetical protein
LIIRRFIGRGGGDSYDEFLLSLSTCASVSVAACQQMLCDGLL